MAAIIIKKKYFKYLPLIKYWTEYKKIEIAIPCRTKLIEIGINKIGIEINKTKKGLLKFFAYLWKK